MEKVIITVKFVQIRHLKLKTMLTQSNLYVSKIMDTWELPLNQINSAWDHDEIFLTCVPVSVISHFEGIQLWVKHLFI